VLGERRQLLLPRRPQDRVGHGPACYLGQTGYAEVMTSSTHDSHGSGPGVITPDGCAVDLYSLLPPGRDPELIHGAIPPGASVLEWFDVVAPSERTVDGIT